MPARRVTVLVLACLAFLPGRQSSGCQFLVTPAEEMPPIEMPAAGLEIEVTPEARGLDKQAPLPKGASARIDTLCVRDYKDFRSTVDLRAQACLSPDGKTLLTLRENGVVRFWDTATGRRLRSLSLTRVSLSLMDLAPDGKSLACAGGNILTVVDTAKGTLVWSARLREGQISFLAVSPDGKAVAWAADAEVRLWDLKTGRELRRFVGHKEPVQLGAFSPDGKLLVTARDKDMRVWEVSTGRELRLLDGHGGYPIRALAFAPDGKTLGSVGADDFLTLWNTTTWRRARRIAVAKNWHWRLCSYVTFSPDGKTAVTRDTDSTLAVWDAGTAQLKHRLGGHFGRIRGALFAPDGKALFSVSEDNTVLVRKWPPDVAAEEKQPKPGPKDVLGNPLPPGALVRMGSSWLRHKGWVTAAAVSPDGKRLAACVQKNGGAGVSLWDIETGKELNWFETLGPDQVGFSRDGKLLAAAVGGAIYLWRPATGERIQQFIAHPNAIASFAFSPDGKMLAVAAKGDNSNPECDIGLFDIASGRERFRLATERKAVRQLVFSADGRTLFSYADGIKGDLRVWSSVTGKLLHRLDTPGPAAVIGPAGRTLAYQETKAQTVLADLASGKILGRLAGDAGWAVAADGKCVWVSNGEAGRCLWDLSDGRKLQQLRWPERNAKWFCFSPDSKREVVGSASQRQGFVFDTGLRLWDLASDKEVRPLPGHRDTVTCLAFAPNMRTLATGSSDNTLRLWEAKTGRELRTLLEHSAPLTALAFAPDGRTLAVADESGILLLCDSDSGKVRARVKGDGKGIPSLTFTPDGKTLLAVTAEGDVIARDTVTAKELHRSTVGDERGAALALSPDGTVVVSVVRRAGRYHIYGPLLFRDRATDRVLATIEAEKLEVFQEATFSPTGRMVAVRGGIDNLWNGAFFQSHIRLFEVASGREILRLKEQYGPLAFSLDGRILAVGDVLWDLATGKEAGRLNGHFGGTRALAFSPNGTRLATGGADTTALVWQRSTIFTPAALRGGPAPLAALWADLAGADAAKANAAGWRLVADPGRTVPFLRKQLQPPPAPDAARLARLIADLDSDTFAVRKQAELALDRHGELAEPALRAVLQSKPSVEVYQRAKRLLDRIEASRASPRYWRTMRALAILESIGGRQAQGVLETLARGPAGAWATREAQASLLRLSRRRASEAPGGS